MRFLTAIAIAQQQKARSFKLHSSPFGTRHEPIERADDVRAWDIGRVEISQCNKLPLHRRSCCRLGELQQGARQSLHLGSEIEPVDLPAC